MRESRHGRGRAEDEESLDEGKRRERIKKMRTVHSPHFVYRRDLFLFLVGRHKFLTCSQDIYCPGNQNDGHRQQAQFQKCILKGRDV